MTTNEEMEAVYGPAADHSEYKRGETIRYYRGLTGIHSGEILWVCAPAPIITLKGETKDAPLSYIVAQDDGGFPEVLYSSDIIPPQE